MQVGQQPIASLRRCSKCCREAAPEFLDSLLGLCPAPGERELWQQLDKSKELASWKQEPRSATKVLSALAKKRLPALAANVLSIMCKAGVEVNIYHFGAAISACEKGGGQWQLALHLLGQMTEMRVAPNQITYNTAISACEKGGLWEPALSLLLTSMPDSRSVPDVISYNAGISACEKGGQWQLALTLLNQMPGQRLIPDKISYSAAISALEKASRWQLAVSLLTTMQGVLVMADAIVCSAVISACEKGRNWQLALLVLTSMPDRRVIPNEISYNAAISACEKAGQWRAALGLLSQMSGRALPPDRISFNAAMSSYARGAQWESASILLSSMPVRRILPNEISYNAAINACEKGDQWQMALCQLHGMRGARTLPNEISYNAAIAACERLGHWERGLRLLRESQEKDMKRSVESFPWALARLGVSDPEVIHAAFAEATGRLRGEASLRSPLELSTLAWASAMLGVENIEFSGALTEQVLPQIGEFKLHELLLVAWGSAASGVHLELPLAIQEEVAARLEAFDEQEFPEEANNNNNNNNNKHNNNNNNKFLNMRKSFADSVLGVIWSCNYAGCLSERLLKSSEQAMAQIGRALDSKKNHSSNNKNNEKNNSKNIDSKKNSSSNNNKNNNNSKNNNSNNDNNNSSSNNNNKNNQNINNNSNNNDARGPKILSLPEVAGMPVEESRCESEPKIILDLSDRLVIFKPPKWEVGNADTEFQLAPFLRAKLGQHLPILADGEHGFGFLHRLDLPSSGLLLAAKTYEAFYDLQVQLRSGRVKRDYVVLCHGWMRPSLTDINAHVYWRGLPPSSAGQHGKPSRTQLKVVAHASHHLGVISLSLVVVRIATGRRHQIRTHLAHVGHPTACDGKYTSSDTFQSDLALCERNCLHRYRLAFRDAAGNNREVLVPVPADLADALAQLTPKGGQSSRAICLWQKGHGLRDWEDLTPFAP